MVKNALKKIFCWGRNVQLLKVGRHCHKDVKSKFLKFKKCPDEDFFLESKTFNYEKKSIFIKDEFLSIQIKRIF